MNAPLEGKLSKKRNADSSEIKNGLQDQNGMFG